MWESIKGRYLEEMAESGYSGDSIGAFHKFTVPYLLRQANTKTDDIVLDIGAAHGHAGISAYSAGYRNVQVVDYDDSRFEMFGEKYGFECHRVDLLNDSLPFEDNSVGAILFFETIEHLLDPTNAVTEIHRVLKPGGTAFITTPDFAQVGSYFYEDPTHVRPFIKQGMERLLRIVGFERMEVKRWGTRYGLARLALNERFPALNFIGTHLIAIATKT